ncbi:MAG: response regulator [Spirochaetales bacterium]|nr:response regulator [Spirochaetales bacterium]
MISMMDWHKDFVASLLSLQETAHLFSRDEAGLADLLTGNLSRLYQVDHLYFSRIDGEKRNLLSTGKNFDHGNNPTELLESILGLCTDNPGDRERDFCIKDYDPPVFLKKRGYRISRVLRYTASFGNSCRLELIMINGNTPDLGNYLPDSLRILINPVGQAMEREQLKARLRASREEIARVIDSKSQFLGSLSHEIRSPLNGIICMGSLLRETELTEDQLDLLNIIQFSADNITRIIQNLIDLTLLTSGRVILKKETFSLITLCRNLVKNIQEEVEGKGLSLKVNIQEGIDSFHGDSVRIVQILSNLLQNAVKYTREGEIFLDISGGEDSVEFVVSDTGMGIPPEKQEFIFEEFAQLGNPVQKGQSRGIGLGLAIVKDLSEMMGGSVSVRSREGKGSSFTVTLPRPESEVPVREERSGENSLSPMEGASILVVDDDEINRLYLKTTLEGRDARIDEAHNGQEAVEKAAGKSYDLILMDISMPVMNGLDATREIRKMKKNLPVLAVTANAFEEDFKRITEAGLDDVVLKPVDEEQLMTKISTWLERKRRGTDE